MSHLSVIWIGEGGIRMSGSVPFREMGSGTGAGVAITSGMLGSVGVAAGGQAKARITRAGRIGMSLSRYTGSS